MTKLVWDQAVRSYEAGVDRGVYYPRSGPGEVWNGLTSVQESPSDADGQVRYIDGVKTRTRKRPGYFEGKIEAFTYPETFYVDALEPVRPKTFGMTYRTKTESSYKIHLVYNILLGPTTHVYDQDEAVPFSWDFTTLPIKIPHHRASAHLIVDAGAAYPSALAQFEGVLYGDDAADARLPSPTEVIEIFEMNAILKITDNGDGTWTAEGPDDVVSMLNPTTFQIDWPSVVYLDSWTYSVSSH